MNKVIFWKIINFLEQDPDCDQASLNWFEAMCLCYALDPALVDEYAAALDFYNLKEEK